MTERKIRALAACESSESVEILGLYLDQVRGWSVQLHGCNEPGKLIQRLERDTIDVLFLGCEFGEPSGLVLLQQLRSRGFSTPVILLAERGEEDMAASAIRSGAADYLSMKTLWAESLERALQNAFAEGSEDPDGPWMARLQSDLEAIADGIAASLREPTLSPVHRARLESAWTRTCAVIADLVQEPSES